MYILIQKLQNLKKHRKIWNKEVCGDIHQLVQTSTTNLSTIQDKIILMGLNDNSKEPEIKAQHALDLALEKEELF